MRNNRIETARELCRRSIAMCSAANEPWCTENYHPESGEPFFTCNIFNYIWGGIFNDILIRRIMGIQCFAPRNQLVINPLLNDDVHYLSISNLKMSDHSFEIKLTKDSENIRLELTHKGAREVRVLTSNGEKILYNSTINEKIETFKVEHWLA